MMAASVNLPRLRTNLPRRQAKCNLKVGQESRPVRSLYSPGKCRRCCAFRLQCARCGWCWYPTSTEPSNTRGAPESPVRIPCGSPLHGDANRPTSELRWHLRIEPSQDPIIAVIHPHQITITILLLIRSNLTRCVATERSTKKCEMCPVSSGSIKKGSFHEQPVAFHKLNIAQANDTQYVACLPMKVRWLMD